MKIKADREVCVGAGMCALTAPELFDQDDEDGRVVVLRAEPAPEQAEAVREAVELCPSGALSVEDSLFSHSFRPGSEPGRKESRRVVVTGPGLW